MAMDPSIFSNSGPFEKLDKNLDELHTNLENLEKLHTNFIQFNESVSSLIYGLNINAWCTEFQEAPTMENFSQKIKEDQVDLKISQLIYKIEVLENNESKIPVRSLSSLDTPEVSELSLLTDESFVVNPKKQGNATVISNKPGAAASDNKEGNNNIIIKSNNTFKKPISVSGISKPVRNKSLQNNSAGSSSSAVARRQSRIPTLKKHRSVLPKK